MGMGVDSRNRMARRAAEEIQTGMVVNLELGFPLSFLTIYRTTG